MTERDLLAAELALGVLEGESLLGARGQAAADPAFAAEVAAWEERFAPLFDEIDQATPAASLWPRIRAALDTGGGEVVALRRRVDRWRTIAGAASAIAASLLLVVAVGPLRQIPEPAPQATPAPAAPMMVASLMGPDKHAMMLSATWQPSASALMITPGDMPPAAGHSHELWLIPADGKPRSLGIVHGDKPARMVMPKAMADQFGADVMLAVSVEPEGGSPGAGPTGPVVASGRLLSV